MKTWLFIWNPNRWKWSEAEYDYNELRLEIPQTGFGYIKWTCGINKSICEGDRIFLIRLGVPERGIVASGYAASKVFEGTHWDMEKRKAGKLARRVYIKVDKMLDIDNGVYLPYDRLQEIDSKYHWSSLASGVLIPEETAARLEECWKEY